ncbi:uncharacterized protein LOC127519866 [Ctenopharyngodon idella]|uniref:uncharacterized protein LOC127519866 n=1 Tax=Ctenopharyngodon idella TaxID=7959 RepID=UPI00222F5DF8|nr:uncharacterized protein LOC127519866 [Ctenopharyngodon idella]XP_051763491.1 uncharacterized protein LOC127519866 [Ctenopharyngodon idella]XP_051763492.1 uncharacterized protein LOC127519866 [Ctenopharyngodon idella]XP_051763494.1 uncharacterized protein LOC127519866 [Ctenopharyngodon idella]
MSVMEGDSVTLHTAVKTNQQDRIRWYFNDIRIAQITRNLSKTCADKQCGKRFRNRLKLDHQTGSLTITSIKTSDTGLYKLKILGSSSSEKIFNVTVHDVSAAERDEMKRKSVKEGESVTLDSGLIKTLNDSIIWYFNQILIAEITGDQSKICTDVQCDERFRDRLKLDHQTGSLTITNITNTDSGEYKLKISSSNSNIDRIFTVITVIAVSDSSSSVEGICISVVLLIMVSAAGVFCY